MFIPSLIFRIKTAALCERYSHNELPCRLNSELIVMERGVYYVMNITGDAGVLLFRHNNDLFHGKFN
nr:hypothetical protein FQY85_02120 [Cronobacter turicensis]